MDIETVYAIMLPDNNRALNLTRKMGFKFEYLSDGTVKGVLDLKEEVFEEHCRELKSQLKAAETEKDNTFSSKAKEEAKQ